MGRFLTGVTASPAMRNIVAGFDPDNMLGELKHAPPTG
jgi:hypothetical protein